LANSRPKRRPPLADAFVADHHVAGGQDQLDVTQAEAETVIQPDRMLDDLGWMALAISSGWCTTALSMA
jgi:hypothetical protein